MRNKTPLILMELACMLLVFALSAVLCLQAFVWADTASKESVKQDRALREAQNVAESVKGLRGDFSAAEQFCGGLWDDDAGYIRYNGNWEETEEEGTYVLRCLRTQEELEYMEGALVEVLEGEQVLASLRIAWQGVDAHE